MVHEGSIPPSIYQESSGNSTKRTTKNRWWNCVQTDKNKCKIINWEEKSKNRADWEKVIKEVKAHSGLYCH